MKKFTALMPSWRGAELLSASIPSILDSFNEDSELIVVLNEADKESINICLSYKIKFICLPENHGTLAIDYASELIEGQFVSNVNSDMLFIKGWDSEMIKILTENAPCSASCFLVEPFGIAGANPIVLIDDLGHVTDPQTRIKFETNWSNGKYKFDKKRISFTHPITVTASDYFAVGGYSNHFYKNHAYRSGYSNDDAFAWRLWNLYNGKFKHIASEKYCVYHQSSATNFKLPPEIKNKDNHSVFIDETGMTIPQFKKWINCFSTID